MKSVSKYSTIQIHPDLQLLYSRLYFLIETEQYEKAVVIKKWIDELKQIHDTD